MNNLIEEYSIVKKALKLLDISASKVLVVVNKQNQLLGTISDGDIRRYLLNGGLLGDDINNVYNNNPVVIKESDKDNKTLLKQIFIEKKIELIPILSENREVIDTISWENIFAEKKISRKQISFPVIIMAGGKGTRLEPFTNVLPKPLIPVGDKTMVEYIIDEYRNYSIDKFYLTINYKKNMIKAYFETIEKNYDIKYIEENDYYGTAGSLKLIDVVPETCIVSNCDISVKADYNDVLEFHNNNNSVLTILSSIQHYVIPYGVVEFNNGGKVTKIIEKPEHSMPINTGVYVLNKEVFDYIPEKKYFHMTHLIETLITEGKKVMTYLVNENDYIDIGQWKEYRNSVQKLG